MFILCSSSATDCFITGCFINLSFSVEYGIGNTAVLRCIKCVLYVKENLRSNKIEVSIPDYSHFSTVGEIRIGQICRHCLGYTE